MIKNLDYYRTIQGAKGVYTAKEAEIRQIKGELARDFGNSLDCESVLINGTKSLLQVTKAADYTIKNISTKPDNYIYLGDVIHWCDTDWIVDTIDADTRIATRGKMRRCNVLLKWLDEKGSIRTASGFCEDAAKYSDGVSGEKVMRVPDFQIKVKIRLDEHSAKINRDKRFLLDTTEYLSYLESSGEHPSAFIVTRRNVLTGNHLSHGYTELTLTETAFSSNDNTELMIADYYNRTVQPPLDDETPATGADINWHLPQGDSVVYGQTLRADFKLFVNGLEYVSAITCQIVDSFPAVATVEEVGQNHVIIRAVNKSSNQGATFALRLRNEQFDKTVDIPLRVRGWL